MQLGTTHDHQFRHRSSLLHRDLSLDLRSQPRAPSLMVEPINFIRQHHLFTSHWHYPNLSTSCCRSNLLVYLFSSSSSTSHSPTEPVGCTQILPASTPHDILSLPALAVIDIVVPRSPHQPKLQGWPPSQPAAQTCLISTWPVYCNSISCRPEPTLQLTRSNPYVVGSRTSQEHKS